MDLFEYISVLTSIIIGLGIAHLLRGVAHLVQHPGRHRIDWSHLVWVTYLFFHLAFWWWWQFALNDLPVWQFQNYIFLVIYAVILYLTCALLFPTDLDDYSGYEDYYFSRRKWLFGLIGTSYVIDVYDTWLKGADHLLSLGMHYRVVILSYVLFSAIAVATTRRWGQAVVAVAVVTHQVDWAFQFWSMQG